MPRTTVKSLRLTMEEIGRLQRLKTFYPESDSESALLSLIFLRGLLLCEAEVVAAGGAVPSGMTEEHLATLLLQRMLIVIHWLSHTTAQPLLVPPVRPSPPATALQLEPIDQIDPQAADDLAQLGSDFL